MEEFQNHYITETILFASFFNFFSQNSQRAGGGRNSEKRGKTERIPVPLLSLGHHALRSSVVTGNMSVLECVFDASGGRDASQTTSGLLILAHNSSNAHVM
jgi:hypothetical protein